MDSETANYILRSDWGKATGHEAIWWKYSRRWSSLERTEVVGADMVLMNAEELALSELENRRFIIIISINV